MERPQTEHTSLGRRLMLLSIATRFGTLILLASLALWTEYLNLKVGYGNARLVELSGGRAMRLFYQASDAFFSFFGDPLTMAQKNAGMTWSIRLAGLPVTDPLALLSLIATWNRPTLGFLLGGAIPLLLALLCGRVFCGYLCPASLLFFAIGRIRHLLDRFFLFPDIKMDRGLAWGLLFGGLVLAYLYGHGVWILILPYFAMGQTLFQGLAFGALSTTAASLLLFALLDLFLGNQFTCRYLCPTGRLLGWIGTRPILSMRRDPHRCLDGCAACAEVCPLRVDPRRNGRGDCTLCGECAAICPTACLSIGREKP